MDIVYNPIGYFRTPFSEIKGMPIQPIGANGIEGSIEVLPEFREGLKDLEGFSHVFVLYHLHEIKGYDLLVKPFLDKDRHGIFATRSPKRPNPIGLSVMRLKGVNEDSVLLECIDVLDRTPVIDIKPYVADFDCCDADRFGWFEGKSGNARHHRSDERFAATQNK
ncbi:MAG: tRNA (N6-threonylcarbamoyladenosine(37)-N6)-methyltransferase TrmO [Desulfobulbaceae bacterium]|nr:tRNA (N6-threonylcarbamoyladenosine(37)-N6)-methyltransferase TrmO [Desulfobulbaceae bacterium]